MIQNHFTTQKGQKKLVISFKTTRSHLGLKKNVVYKQLLNNQASKMDYQQLDHIFSGEKMWYGKVQKELDHIYDGEKRWFSAFANN